MRRLQHSITGLVVEVVEDNPGDPSVRIKSGSVSTLVSRAKIDHPWPTGYWRSLDPAPLRLFD